MAKVTFVAGNGPEATLGAWLCWHRWSLEEHGREIDHEAWLRQQAGKVAGGAFLQVIGWDGAEPVAMVEMVVVYDPMQRVQIAHGDKAWVHPDYRKDGTLTAMLNFMVPLMDYIGVEHWVAPVTAGEEATAPWLREMYEKLGFRLAGLTLVRKPERKAA